MLLQLNVNGREITVEAGPTETLLHVLRERLNLRGAKEACGRGECGACAVIMDGKLVNSCLVIAAQAEGARVLTVEGLVGDDGVLHPLQQSFVDAGAVQCGYCTPGMVMSAYALLQAHPHPTERQVMTGMAGNLCRCTGYQKIVAAVMRAAEGGVK